ncbi:MAG: glycerophosphodiester phosphodiesterase family protein [Ruminococcaceae bacterium]|nr:glycerophosphodiester phosphodiesterase family protein [Oscillospiraceae bacterium]
MKFNLREDAARNMMLVAHRGFWGGNIPCNTVPAFDTALRHGADMIEIDLDRTADGKLVIFHPGMEQALLGFSESIERLPFDFVKQLRYINIDNVPTQFGIPTFDEILERYKDKCYINVDKFWTHPREISDAIRAHGMADQMVVKAKPKKEMLDIVEEFCADMPYMAIISDEKELELLKGRRLNFVGSEVLFREDTARVASAEFIKERHDKGEIVWCNSIVYNYRTVIAADRTDDRAMCGDPEGSWGWIADRGFDLMQTDMVLEAALFLEKTGRRKRR